MMIALYVILVIVAFLLVTVAFAIFFALLGANSDQAIPCGLIGAGFIAFCYFVSLVAQQNPLGLAFQSS